MATEPRVIAELDQETAEVGAEVDVVVSMFALAAGDGKDPIVQTLADIAVWLEGRYTPMALAGMLAVACEQLAATMFQWPLPAPEVQREPASPFPMCLQCGHRVAQVIDGEDRFCGDECQHNWRVSEYRGWYPR